MYLTKPAGASAMTSHSQIEIPEIEYYHKNVLTHAQIRPQGAEKQLRKVKVGGGGWYAAKHQYSYCIYLA